MNEINKPYANILFVSFVNIKAVIQIFFFEKIAIFIKYCSYIQLIRYIFYIIILLQKKLKINFFSYYQNIIKIIKVKYKLASVLYFILENGRECVIIQEGNKTKKLVAFSNIKTR